MFKIAFSLFYNINQSACSTLDWVLNSQSDLTECCLSNIWNFQFIRREFQCQHALLDQVVLCALDELYLPSMTMATKKYCVLFLTGMSLNCLPILILDRAPLSRQLFMPSWRTILKQSWLSIMLWGWHLILPSIFYWVKHRWKLNSGLTQLKASPRLCMHWLVIIPCVFVVPTRKLKKLWILLKMSCPAQNRHNFCS